MSTSSNTVERSGSLDVVEVELIPSPPMNPELLMAACHGWDTKLTSLLNGEEQGTTTTTTESLAIIVEVGRGTAAASPQPSPSSSLLRGVTSYGDSALHVVAAAGDRDEHLRSAMVIYGKARHLLEARNKVKSTPLHLAARASNVKMLALLVRLAAGEEEEGEERVRALLSMQNEVGETALHEAIRADDMEAVDVLMTADPCLARVPEDGGASPLYLAIALRRCAIARDLHERDSQLSYSGPAGQNALHAAVLQSKGEDPPVRTFGYFYPFEGGAPEE